MAYGWFGDYVLNNLGLSVFVDYWIAVIDHLAEQIRKHKGK
jgi:hypothetical protein